ncbi:MAG: 5'/3'-nucleotidase SurE [Clostridia bacterium]|nr:5'/3'-nucleotidase SurE [Clostridia bacterium]
MRILITNDDGINAEGIRALAEWAMKLGEITVVAPKVEQSGKSHGIEFTKHFEIKKVDFLNGTEAYSVDSTPADCVRFGFMGLGREYDLVLSGINRGVNLGADMVYSGTVGAIFEAGRLGCKGVALSTYPTTLDEALAELDSVWERITKGGYLDINPLYNVNIPPKPKGFKITKQGSPYFSDEFIYEGDNMYMQMGGKIPDVSPEDMTRDTVATEAGYITITPLLCTRTNMEAYEKLSRKSD